MIRTFTIEFPDESGPLWMNVDNLLMCLTTKTCCRNSHLIVKDITDDEHNMEPAEYKPSQSSQKSKKRHIVKMPNGDDIDRLGHSKGRQGGGTGRHGSAKKSKKS